MKICDVLRPLVAFGFTLAFAFTASGAEAELKPLNALELVEWCESSESRYSVICSAYLAGWSDGYGLGKDKSLTFCAPPGVTVAQTTRIILRDATTKPEKLNQQAGEFVLSTLARAFPCDR